MNANQHSSRQKKGNFYFVLLAVFFLLVGAYIYISMRNTEAVFIGWLKIVGAENFLNFIKSTFPFNSAQLPVWVVYVLPDFLWAAAYSLLIIVLWWNSGSAIKYFWLSTIPVLIFGYELAQIASFFPGTFSWYDMAAGLLGIIFAVILFKRTNNIDHPETNTLNLTK